MTVNELLEMHYKREPLQKELRYVPYDVRNYLIAYSTVCNKQYYIDIDGRLSYTLRMDSETNYDK